MSLPYYTGNPENRRQDGAAKLPGSRRARQTDPAGYLPDKGLVDAVNVALLLGQPLLLTGEPGTGKTQLAYSLAWELGFDVPLIFETKSSSTARDLFYGYDTLSRFHAAQTGEGSNASLDYLTWHALGIAILQSRPLTDVEQWLTKDFLYNGPRRSVVLIDEIDKAPRDFPNDLLNEVENLYFRVPELGNARIAASEARAQQGLVQFEQTVALALEETEGAFSGFNRNAQRAQSLDAAARHADEAAQLARARFDGGVTDFQAVLLAEREALGIREQLVQARVAQAGALVAVYRAIGGGWIPTDQSQAAR